MAEQNKDSLTTEGAVLSPVAQKVLSLLADEGITLKEADEALHEALIFIFRKVKEPGEKALLSTVIYG